MIRVGKFALTAGLWASVLLSRTGASVVHVAEPPDGELLYQAQVESPDGPDLEIFLVRTDGSQQRRLTTSPGGDMDPVWSPDGRRIAFVADRESTVEQKKSLIAEQMAGRIGPPTQNVYVMDSDGSNLRKLTQNGGFAPAWSPDGRRIAFVTATDWQPSDSLRVWGAKRDIYVINTDGTGLQNVTNHTGSDNFPTWSPDGRSIAFSSTREGHEWAEIYVADLASRRPRRLTFNSPGMAECCDDSYPRWSPDGRLIAFVSKRDGNSEIYTMHPDGTAQTRITNDPGFDAYASWSPDSRYLVFTHRAERAGIGSLYIMRADGTERRPVGVVGRSPHWRPGSGGQR